MTAFRRNWESKIDAGMMEREHRDFGACAVYVIIETGSSSPAKIGYAQGPISRLSTIQNGNWRPIEFAFLRWTAGKPLAARIERHVIERFNAQHRSGEWFNVPASEMEQTIVAFAAEIGARLTTDQELQDYYTRRIMKRWNSALDAI